ncbi:MAG TPA: chloride channel protein [Chloroflexi bacterium]|nr:chloride channel protein [Chloroflexota bacterium]
MTSSAKTYFPNLLDHFKPSRTSLLLITSILVGAGTGLGAVFFIRLIAEIQHLFFVDIAGIFDNLGRLVFVLVPTIGGLLSGPIITFFASEAKGHGVPEVMQAIAMRGGRIRPRVVVAKIAASALCIGTGGSAGREGPIVQVGAALGSTLGQWLHLSDERIRNLVACGAAAGIAATFNAPIAGAIFAMEVILGEMVLADLGSVVISAVTASTLARVFLGERPAFVIPNYGVQTPWEVLLYMVLGLLAAFVAIGFIRMLYKFEDIFDEWRFPDALKPAVGGLLLGGLAYFYPMVLSLGYISASEGLMGIPTTAHIPHIFGSGFPVIESALLGQLSFPLLLALVFLKPIATSLTLGSGNSGGVFAPALFTGAALGGSFGLLVERLLPGATAGPGAFATVGMAAVFAGAARAPFTAILIVFEMTDDYRLIVPLMAGVIVSLIVSERLHKESIYTLKLVRKGINIFRGRDMDIMASVLVQEVMEKQPETVSPQMAVSELIEKFGRTGRHGFPVVDELQLLIGIVSLSDVRRLSHDQPDAALEEIMVKDITSRNPIVAYPDESLRAVLQRMAPRDLSRLPVVSREGAHKLVGVIRRRNIIKAYDLGLVRRGFALGRLPGSPPGTATGRFLIPASSYLVEKTLAELCLPEHFLIIHIERAGEMILPHGDTGLQSGDILTMLSYDGDIAKLEAYWNEISARPCDEPKEPQPEE